MTEPKGCPTPGACSALEQIAELTKDRDHWREAYRNTMAAADLLIEIERQRVRDALENSARLIEKRNYVLLDAERYRFLRDSSTSNTILYRLIQNAHAEERFDKAIDDAMASTSPTPSNPDEADDSCQTPR